MFERTLFGLYRMNCFHRVLLLGALCLGPCFDALAQSTAPVDYEAVALRHFLVTLLPQDHPTYHKLTYSGYVLPDPFAFHFPPCFTPYDSLRHDATFVRPSRSTGKAVPVPPGSAFKVVTRSGRNIPWVGVSDALVWRTRRLVPICLSLRYHYTDYYNITLSPTGQVLSSCRKQTIQ